MGLYLTSDERAVQAKVKAGRELNADDRQIIQARAVRAGMSRGEARQAVSSMQARVWPAGSTVRMVDPRGETQPVVDLANRLATQVAGGHNRVDWNTVLNNAGLENALSSSGPHTFTINHPETTGVNHDWTGSVRIEVYDDHKVEGSTRDTSVTAGGSASGTDTTGNTSSRESGSSGSATGSHTPPKTGGAGGSATVTGTDSSTSGSSRSSAGTRGDTSSGTLETRDENWTGKLRAHVTVNASVSSHWSDVVNPFAWGFHAGGAMLLDGPKSGQADCGTINWVQNLGLR